MAGCEYCMSGEPLIAHIINGHGIFAQVCIYTDSAILQIEASDCEDSRRIYYCPICGKKLK